MHISPRALTATLCGAALAALLIVAYVFDPSAGTFPYPRCLFKSLTGWDCPGCGSTRALHALLHGRVGEALSLNAAAPVGVLLAAGALVADRLGSPRLRRAVLSPAMAATVLLLAAAWTLARNLL